MSIFGSILKEVVGGVVDTIEIGASIAKDTVKAPIRVIDKLVDPDDDTSFLGDTKKKLEEL